MCSDFLAESLVIRKLQGSKLTFFENFSQKKGFRKFQVTFLGYKSVKNGKLYHLLDVRKSQERQVSEKFYNNCCENSRSQIVFRIDIFRKLTLGAPDLSPGRTPPGETIARIFVGDTEPARLVPHFKITPGYRSSSSSTSQSSPQSSQQ